MPTVAFLHDTDFEILGGAELSCQQIIREGEESGFQIVVDPLKDFETTKRVIDDADIVIANNLFRCDYEFDLIEHLLRFEKPCIRWEHDYGFCARRTALCFVDQNVRHCCAKQRVDLYRRLFQHAILNVFQSPLHERIHHTMFGQIIHPRILLPPPIDVSKLKIQTKRPKSVVYVGLLNLKKGSDALYRYALDHPDHHITIIGEDRSDKQWPDHVVRKGKIKQEEVFTILSAAESFFFQPCWPEPSGRAVVEAYLARCRLIINDRIGSTTYPYFPSDYQATKKAVAHSAAYFWKAVGSIDSKKKRSQEDTRRIHLVKSYGGMGDFFLAFPAIKKVHDRYPDVQTTVPDVLLELFRTSFPEMKFSALSEFDGSSGKNAGTEKIVELYNYPFENKNPTPGIVQLGYPTQQRVRQHATEHYIQAISRIFPRIDLENADYPYLKIRPDTAQYPTKHAIVIHPGAGYLKKCWPADRYILLIDKSLNLLPGIKIQILSDEDHPELIRLIDTSFNHVDIIDDKPIIEIAQHLTNALCYVGNDSGITHLAGALNVPSVVIHGPTGPGTWSSSSSDKIIVYGKKTCERKCNYATMRDCKEMTCLSSITVDEILAAVLTIIGKNNANAHDSTASLFLIKNPLFDFSSQDGKMIIRNQVNAEEFHLRGHLKEVRTFIDRLNRGIHYTEIKNHNQDIQELVQVFVDQSIAFFLPESFLRPSQPLASCKNTRV